MKISLRLAIVALAVIVAFTATGCPNGEMAKKRKRSSLCVTAIVESISFSKETPSYVVFKVSYCFVFKNDGGAPVIMLKPDEQNHQPWFEGIRLANSLNGPWESRYVHSESHGPALDDSPEWNALRHMLDQPTPPPDLTLILQPGESWEERIASSLSFEKKGIIIRPNRPWSVISGISPLFLEARFIIWPFNLEPDRNWDNPRFGKKLRKRWQKYGTLWLDDLTSAPIPICLPRIPD